MQTFQERFETLNVEVYSVSVRDWLPQRNHPELERRLRQAMNDWPHDASHWVVTVEHEGKTFSTDYHMGSAYKGTPEPMDVLNALITDAMCYRTSESRADFAANLGYEYGPDATSKERRKVDNMYALCKAADDALVRLFGEEVVEELIFDTEPLYRALSGPQRLELRFEPLPYRRPIARRRPSAG